MRLPVQWEEFLKPFLNLNEFYRDLELFLKPFPDILPQKDLIFNVFQQVSPDKVSCVLYGEDPYPRSASANGIAFWDAEIESW